MNHNPSKSAFVQKIPFQLDQDDIVTPHDITSIICLRLHEGNPWAAERLRQMATHYNPMPKTLVLDYGSQPQHASIIRAICEECGYNYVFEDDTETYSPAAAHNRGFEWSTTPLVFFCDIDCFGNRTLFADLARVATSLRMKSVVDTPLILPVYHLGEEDTKQYYNCTTDLERSSYLDAFSHYALNAPFNKADNFFIAPYSNIYLINRKMFNMTGGYDERFRGHGSEDFEYLTRLGLHMKIAPGTSNLTSDKYGPLTSDFFDPKPYVGFRRFFEALSYTAESFGLKVFHLYHPRVRTEDWQSKNDWRRENLNASFKQYVADHPNMLNVDFIKREKKLFCLCYHPDHWSYFLPFRLEGYQTEIVRDFDNTTLARISSELATNENVGIAIFNPHMKSHAGFRPLLMLSEDLGRQTIVIERGALPNTIYYDEEVAYASKNFTLEAFQRAKFSAKELEEADKYVSTLRKGDQTLESMNSYTETADKYSWVLHLKRTVCFIPLQLEDDMAVTMFLKGETNYSDFFASLNDVVINNEDILFVIKPHPLSNFDSLKSARNLIVADREDNVHFLLDICSLTLCYNSGVGLLSYLHAKPTFTLGNAFYRLADGVNHAANAYVAVEDFKDGKYTTPNSEDIKRVAAWFLFKRYSKFSAKDDIRDFGHRKSHGYKEILITDFNWQSNLTKLHRQRDISPFNWKSYVSGRLGFRYKPTTEVGTPIQSTPTNQQQSLDLRRRTLVPIVRPFVRVLGTKKDDAEKFAADPSRFFRKLKNPIYRRIGAVLFP